MTSPSRHVLKIATPEVKKPGFLEWLIMFVAIAEPLMTLPQIIQIWTTRDIHGVSLATWGLYIFASFIWLIYGVKIRNNALIVTGAMWVLVESTVVVGILTFR
jgi:uncharacterized protein with PQ loop repeat